jgi:hypothetical protein
VIFIIWNLIEDRSEHRSRNRALLLEQQNEDLQIVNKDKILNDDELDEFMSKRIGPGAPKGPNKI